MSDQVSAILNRNFILKRVGDELYLPCQEPISIKAPPFVGTAAFILCRTSRFDVSTGTLLLSPSTTYERWNENAYEISIETNSAIIRSSGVRSFEILWGSSRAADFPKAYEWTDLENAAEWKPLGSDQDGPAPNGQAATGDLPPSSPFFYDEKCRITIEALNFADGKVSFTRSVHPRVGEITFEMELAASKKEFDAVKEYFAKALRSKVVECQITVVAAGRVIQSATAHLCQPEVFSPDLIEKVDELIIRDQILGSDDEISLVEEKLKLLVCPTGEQWTLEELLERMGKLKRSKHYYQLRYLASLHEADVSRLRMTGSPVSFVFVVRGALDYYLVWETYESEEATYIWKLTAADGKSRQAQMNNLLEKIKWLRKNNKNAYIRSHPLGFTRIEHDYSDEDGGLQKWKLALTRWLT